MEDKILKELRQIKDLLSEIIGTTDLPANEKFSKEAISKIAREYRALTIKRGEWVPKYDIKDIIKHAPYNEGAKILIEKLGFTCYFKFGKTTYFNKKALMELNKELKARKIDLEVYSRLLNDKEKFEKSVKELLKPTRGKKPKSHFKIPEGLRDIFTSPYSAPTEELVRNDMNTLMEEYKKFDLSEYIDLYLDKTHAMFKYDYYFDRYLKPDLKRFCKHWCNRYNYAQIALRRILELKPQEN